MIRNDWKHLDNTEDYVHYAKHDVDITFCGLRIKGTDRRVPFGTSNEKEVCPTCAMKQKSVENLCYESKC